MQDENRQRFAPKLVAISISGRLKRRNDMETHKIYYAVIILVCAASMLLSPFFYICRTRSGAELRRAPRQWKPILFANIIMIVALFVWWKWF
nr:hypothetical protein [uncultured Neisseria sp.]